MRKVVIEVRCPFCGHISVLGVSKKDYFAWRSGELAQNCFSYLDFSERETIISGICLKCQGDVFGSDNNEDYEPADIDNDCGFDPYMGCFTDDC